VLLKLIMAQGASSALEQDRRGRAGRRTLDEDGANQPVQTALACGVTPGVPKVKQVSQYKVTPLGGALAKKSSHVRTSPIFKDYFIRRNGYVKMKKRTALIIKYANELPLNVFIVETKHTGGIFIKLPSGRKGVLKEVFWFPLMNRWRGETIGFPSGLYKSKTPAALHNGLDGTPYQAAARFHRGIAKKGSNWGNTEDWPWNDFRLGTLDGQGLFGLPGSPNENWQVILYEVNILALYNDNDAKRKKLTPERLIPPYNGDFWKLVGLFIQHEGGHMLSMRHYAKTALTFSRQRALLKVRNAPRQVIVPSQRSAMLAANPAAKFTLMDVPAGEVKRINGRGVAYNPSDIAQIRLHFKHD